MSTGVTSATLRKDLRLEWRSKDAINSMLFFSLLVVVVFSFSFDPNAEESRRIAGGLIWVARFEIKYSMLTAYRRRRQIHCFSQRRLGISFLFPCWKPQ